jgi:hypothetical protein
MSWHVTRARMPSLHFCPSLGLPCAMYTPRLMLKLDSRLLKHVPRWALSGHTQQCQIPSSFPVASSVWPGQSTHSEFQVLVGASVT